MEEYDAVNMSIDSGICRLKIDRADTLNALDVSTVEALIESIDVLREDDEVTVIILSSAGDRAFSSGSDVSEFASGTLPEHVRKNELLRQLYETVDQAEQPIIAEIDGPAYGSGAELVLACDLRIASTDAVFCMAEISLGLVPPTGRLMRAVGEQTARELCYTGRTVDAAEGLEIGVYLDVVDPDELTDQTDALAASIAEAPRSSIALTKRNLNLSRDKSAEDTLAHNFYSFSVAFSDPDVQDYIDAYLDENL